MKKFLFITCYIVFFLVSSCTSIDDWPELQGCNENLPGYGYCNRTVDRVVMFSFPRILDSLNAQVGPFGNSWPMDENGGAIYFRHMLPLKDSTGIRLVFGDSLKCLNFEGPITDSLVDPRSPKAYKVNGEAYRYTFEPKHFEMASPCK